MPVLIIGGEGKMPEKKSGFMKPLREKRMGIGSKYAESEMSDAGEDSESQEGDGNARKLEASKLLLRAIDRKDPELIAQAISTLVECCSEDGDGAEDEGEDLGEKD